MSLKRKQIRRRLMAVLCNEEIPQGIDGEGACLKGPLWLNCQADGGEGEAAEVFDTSNRQLVEDIEDGQQVVQNQVVINFKVPDVSYTLTRKGLDNSRVRFYIEIAVTAPDGETRQDILDEIEMRLFYRLMSHAPIKDLQTGEDLTPIMTMAKQNSFKCEVTDDTSPLESNVIREYTFTLDTNECLVDLNCEIQPLCFDFSALTKLTKGNENDT